MTQVPKRKLNNVTQRADGRWVARKIFGYKPNGKPNRKSFYAGTAFEASQKLSDYERQVENGLNADAETLNFSKWLTLWIYEYKLKSLRPHTYDTYETLIKFRIIPALGKYKLLKLRPEHLQAFINNLKKENGEALSVSTIKKIKCVISGALKQAVKNGLITRNPADALSLPKRNKNKKVGAFTPTEQTIFLKQIYSHRIYALFVLAIGTDMRIGELLALRWSDINFKQNEINVSVSVSRSKDREATTGNVLKSSIKVAEPKTKAGSRVIPMTFEVRQALVKHREAQTAERFHAQNAWTDNGLVFCTALGGYLEYRNVTRLYERQRELSGISDLTFHCLRHTFATNAISAGLDYYYLYRIMGHTTISVTLDVYAEYMPDKSRSEMEKMEGVLSLKFA